MSQQITEEDVKKIAKLARVGLTDAETKQAAKDLAGVLENFSQIQDIDTKDVPTSDDVTGLKNVTREDKAKSERLATHQQLMENAPETKDGQIKIKSVF